MDTIIFRYRSRQLSLSDIKDIKDTINQYYAKGRTHISQQLCKKWGWLQPNGKLKEYAARDLLLRLEENSFIKLPPRIKQNNNLKRKSFGQIPLFLNQDICGLTGDFSEPTIKRVCPKDRYLWDYLIHHYHYLKLPALVGEHVKHIVFINNQVVACLAWSSAAWKIKFRDQFIGWDELTKRKNLYRIANNSRFLILPWVQVKHLASKVLALSLKRLSRDWQNVHGHHVYLAETFVDTARFKGTCYKAANWLYVGHTKGSAKKGNAYHYHGQPKAIYLYPLHHHFRRLLNDDQG
ncbi:hypothetical protein DRO91_09690 [Candidatus Heimdallarchaeota archaeon]|nr:MAG: hypothetical protein DRO91_09690 [Candidatus Heimdallarchaeota archaeon]